MCDLISGDKTMPSNLLILRLFHRKFACITYLYLFFATSFATYQETNCIYIYIYEKRGKETFFISINLPLESIRNHVRHTLSQRIEKIKKFQQS